MIKTHQIFFAAAIACLPVTASFASIVADFSFPNTDEVTGFQSVDTDLDSTATALSVNNMGPWSTPTAGYGLSSFHDLGGTAPQFFVRTNSISADPVANDEYLEFSITPEAGMQLSYESLDFQHVILSLNAGSVSGSVSVRSSLNGFSSDLGSWAATTGGNSGSTPYADYSVDLSAYSNISETAVFRLYFADDIDAPADTHRLDNLSVSALAGTVPEPATSALIVAGVIGSLVVFRRSRNG